MKRMLLVVLCCLVTICHAQKTANVTIIVSNAAQAQIPLKHTDLKVEIDHQPAGIMSLEPLVEKRYQYVLLYDEGMLPDWPSGAEQQYKVINDFLTQTMKPGEDIGSLVTYRGNIFIDVQNERDFRKIVANLQHTGRGSIKLYDTVQAAANWLRKQPEQPGFRKVMFVFSDGRDTDSSSNLRKAAEALQRDEIPLFIMAPSSIEREKKGDKMRELAIQSGGRVYFLPKNTKQLDFGFIMRDLHQSFLLKITVPSTSKMMPLLITCPGNPEISITAPSQVASTQ